MIKKKRKAVWKPSKERYEKLAELLKRWDNGIPRPEYPRPQFVRREWLCLNGVWDFSFDMLDQGFHSRWQDEGRLNDFIVVPFAPQTELSAKKELDPYPVVWYARNFEVPSQWRENGQNILLHFGAVDYRTTVWVNGHEVGHNQGGHVPFNFDIAPYLKKGKNRLCLRVEDPQDAFQPRGKQSISGLPGGIDYYGTTGIWQTVWLEPAPAVRIQDLRLTPLVGDDPAQDALAVQVFLHAPATGWHLQVEALETAEDGSQRVVAQTENDAAGAVARLVLPMPNAKRWSPDEPNLYDLRVRLLKDGHVLDEVESYAGLRSVSLRDGQFLLNGEPLFLKMVLDQGYWPESYMTAPSDEALRADVEWTKQFGFNGSRKHQKVEDPRWLYWCDKLGLLVWGEMANARGWSPKAEEWFLAEWERAVRRDYNHPCIVTWVPLNESWGVPGLEEDHPGQYAFVERAVAHTRRIDSERPVISNDGWEQAHITDILSIHDYTPTAAKIRKRYAKAIQGGALPTEAGASKRAIFARQALFAGQPIMLTEVGGLLMRPNLPEEQWDPLYKAYGSLDTPEELLKMYRDLIAGLSELPFLAGFCYTQLTDIEQEINGLMTYDRQPKIAPEELAAIHEKYFGNWNWDNLMAWRNRQLQQSRD
ncbi:MAG: hypothetical protein JWN98_2237 [Abditibacteriota bacterium]|nr:hypothetical protein [Abditibacteriota bacterium]